MNGQSESVLDFEIADFEAVPPGQYIAIFKDVQKTKHDQWGEGVMFCFEIAHGQHQGQTATRIGKPNATKQNATGKMIAGITGSQDIGKVSLRPYIGKPYNILMESTQGGKTRISQIWPYQRVTSQPTGTQPPQPPQQARPEKQIDDDDRFGNIPF